MCIFIAAALKQRSRLYSVAFGHQWLITLLPSTTPSMDEVEIDLPKQGLCLTNITPTTPLDLTYECFQHLSCNKSCKRPHVSQLWLD